VTGTLWLVATPIGNLADLTPRATATLAAVDLVCCEDTRRTGRLLQHAGVTARRLAVCNEHTEHGLIEEVTALLLSGGDVAVVSDAGTPGISDPGERLVAAAIAVGATVSAVPGASAVLHALTVSGLPTDRFVMEGFLPRSGAERRDRLADIAAEHRTIVLYEAPHRLDRTLADLRASCGDDRRVALCRELTKMHEEVRRATLGTIEPGEPRGEYVIVLAGRDAASAPDVDDVRAAVTAELAAGATRRDAAATVARRLGVSRRVAYDLAIGAVDPSERTQER
jgi:16S rRNA (cytidine1402-2'-O)-methyltransferase